MRWSRVAVPAMVAGMFVALVAPSAHAASCAEDGRPVDQQVADASVVFVGTAVDVRKGTTARFAVDEVWQGEVPAEVTVLGGPDGAGGFGLIDAVSSVDRTWTSGQRYLVFPYEEDGALHDNSCSPTREWTDELEAARPPSAHAPVPVPATTGWQWPAWATMALAAAAILGAIGVTALVARPDRQAS